MLLLLLFVLIIAIVRISSYQNRCRYNIKNDRITMKYSTTIKNNNDNNDSIEDINMMEWAALVEAEKEQKDAFEEAIRIKLKEWKDLKDSGMLNKLAEDPDMYDDTDNNAIRLPSSNTDKSDEIDNKSVTYFQEKYNNIISKKRSTLKASLLSTTKSSSLPLSLYQLLNEMKDKEQYDTILIQNIIISLVKNDDTNYSISAINLYKKFLNENIVDNNSPRFLMSVVLACFLSNNVKNGDIIMNNLINDNIYKIDDFLPAIVCRAIGDCHDNNSIIKSISSSSSTNDSKKSSLGRLLSKKRDNDIVKVRAKDSDTTTTMDPEEAKAKQSHRVSVLTELKTNIRKYPVDEVNKVVRMLGRYQYIDEVFSLIDVMNTNINTNANEETYEFLTNSLVYTVDETAKASAMTELPNVSNAPEILFAGRSNVGKSSLVNFLVNRKALASTSATPGHTRQFHFFHINKNYENVPSFYFVDVPGLGYAEAEDGQKDSWRSFFERYITVREPFSLLFHLIDARHKITSVDEQMISIVLRSQKIRRDNDRQPFQYALVLTKTDKASEKQLKETVNQAKLLSEKLKLELDLQNEIPIISTSSFSKVGKVDVWRLLYNSLRPKDSTL